MTNIPTHTRGLRMIVMGASIASLSLGSAAFAQGDLKPILQARYAALKAAMAAHDSTGIASILSPGFQSVDLSGAAKGGPQMIVEVNGLPPDPHKVSVTTLLSIKRGANAATVDQRYDMKTVKVGPDGIAHPVELVTLSTDTWVKPTSTWLMQRTVTREMSYFVDGKILFHKVGSRSPD